jgi:hypothetical protein
MMAIIMSSAPERDILLGLEPFRWSNDAATNYEITLEKMSRVVGLYSNLARRPDTSAADEARYRAEMSRWVDVRRTLRAQDTDAVEAVRRECTELIARLSAML